jgi:hypothetical protein
MGLFFFRRTARFSTQIPNLGVIARKDANPNRHAIILPMRTPAGKECKFFYGDYFRGRHIEECRLLADAPTPQKWTPDLCTHCPVPGILLANTCEHMELSGTVHRPFPFIRRAVQVSAYCRKCECTVSEPHIGCELCHTLPPVFIGEPRDPDSTG